MTSIDDLFPSKYLKASDFETPRVCTIARVGRESMKNRDGKEEVKPILFFHEFEKGIVLNKTNAAAVAKLYGKQVEEWPGKTVTVGSALVDSFGDTVPAIRILGAPTAPKPNGNGHTADADPKAVWAKFISDERPLRAQIRAALGTEKPSEWVDAEAGRSLAKAIDLIRAEMHKADEMPF